MSTTSLLEKNTQKHPKDYDGCPICPQRCGNGFPNCKAPNPDHPGKRLTWCIDNKSDDTCASCTTQYDLECHTSPKKCESNETFLGNSSQNQTDPAATIPQKSSQSTVEMDFGNTTNSPKETQGYQWRETEKELMWSLYSKDE